MSKHVVVNLIDGDTHEITQYPTILGDGEDKHDAAIRILDEQQDAQGKHFLVEDIIESPRRGRHRGETE